MSVGDGTLIGMSATLLGRTQIGKECLIAAGAVVPPGLVVPDRMCVMGVPGRIVRPVTEEELKYMRWLAAALCGAGAAIRRRKIHLTFTSSC